MAKSHNLFRVLLRILTPEEIGEVTIKYSEEGRLVTLTDLLKDKIFRKKNRDFSKLTFRDEIQETENNILELNPKETKISDSKVSADRFEHASPVHRVQMRPNTQVKENEDFIALNNHLKDDESVKNMSAFILEEKERLKKSQHTLKQKEVIGLYEKTSSIGRDEIKQEIKTNKESAKKGNLVDRKQ